MNLEDTKNVITERYLDLESVEALLRYIILGVSLSPTFNILSGRLPNSEISKDEAVLIKKEFLQKFEGKPKSYLRVRIPLILVGLVNFSVERNQNKSLDERIANFGKILEIPFELVPFLKSTVPELSQDFYTSKLDTMLDPISNFFDGVRPKSFTNALQELSEMLSASDITVVEDDRKFRIIEDSEDKKPKLEIVVDPVPFVEFINHPKDTEIKRSPNSRSYNLVYAAIGLAAGTVVSFTLRKVLQK